MKPIVLSNPLSNQKIVSSRLSIQNWNFIIGFKLISSLDFILYQLPSESNFRNTNDFNSNPNAKIKVKVKSNYENETKSLNQSTCTSKIDKFMTANPKFEFYCGI